MNILYCNESMPTEADANDILIRQLTTKISSLEGENVRMRDSVQIRECQNEKLLQQLRKEKLAAIESLIDCDNKDSEIIRLRAFISGMVSSVNFHDMQAHNMVQKLRSENQSKDEILKKVIEPREPPLTALTKGQVSITLVWLIEEMLRLGADIRNYDAEMRTQILCMQVNGTTLQWLLQDKNDTIAGAKTKICELENRPDIEDHEISRWRLQQKVQELSTALAELQVEKAQWKMEKSILKEQIMYLETKYAQEIRQDELANEVDMALKRQRSG